jgi:hypothetical protein
MRSIWFVWHVWQKGELELTVGILSLLGEPEVAVRGSSAGEMNVCWTSLHERPGVKSLVVHGRLGGKDLAVRTISVETGAYVAAEVRRVAGNGEGGVAEKTLDSVLLPSKHGDRKVTISHVVRVQVIKRPR